MDSEAPIGMAARGNNRSQTGDAHGMVRHRSGLRFREAVPPHGHSSCREYGAAAACFMLAATPWLGHSENLQQRSTYLGA